MNAVLDANRVTALNSIALIARGEPLQFAQVIAPDAINHESHAEPPSCRVGGPAGFYATGRWLRSTFADLEHRIVHAVAEDDLVVVDTVMSGRHVGPFVLYDGHGSVDTVWAPTGKTFAVSQSHWFKMGDGLVREHWAARDDLGQSLQLGWVPPTPRYLLGCALAKRCAVRAARTVHVDEQG